MLKLLTRVSEKGGCDKIEYQQILNEIEKINEEKNKVNLLVFGLGYDTILWIAANPNGHNVFIEDDPMWIEKCLTLPGIIKVSYRTEYWDKSVIYSEKELELKLPPQIENIPWDIIFVDGPRGDINGRMKSIHKAYQLASDDTTVFIHDYQRPCEKLYTDYFFRDRSIEITKKLAKVMPIEQESPEDD